MEVDISEFATKVPWSERKAFIHAKFPSTVNLDWEKVFRSDPHILGRLINDILKVDSAVPGKPGKRPGLDVKAAEDRLRKVTGDDYTALPFLEAVEVLLNGRPISWLAEHTEGINKNYIYRIMAGKVVPDPYDIEQIATAFRKDPSYFAEYRLLYILGVIGKKLESMPDASVAFYVKLKNGA